jgi:hypothetical protein
LYSAGIRKLIQNSKMYLHNENLFYWFSSTQGKIDTASNGFRELAKELKEYSQELKAMYIKR